MRDAIDGAVRRREDAAQSGSATDQKPGFFFGAVVRWSVCQHDVLNAHAAEPGAVARCGDIAIENRVVGEIALPEPTANNRNLVLREEERLPVPSRVDRLDAERRT